ncbi:hypothetical protein M9H77_10138 [Catharanthus roseus]|uniref:Uncharacterized protein n=1 Tax=Catharanthus roseus TaxID=4058 RepID=A0ACC0C332_CATRO|nr:hypothetical protein M9H77_10138 [Catharanthus roseus]
MTISSDVFTRRVLNFPAIRPCEAVSFSSLLSSLIRLGNQICEYKSRNFFVNKKNARNSIRLIENLLIVLENFGFPDGVSEISSSVILGLSELHFIFQKVRFLLEDCTRDDARLWMLAKSDFVSTQFRVFMKAMWVALDVLPLEKIDICDEVKEVAEFVKMQAMKMDFEIEVEDQRAMRKVFWILDDFEGGINPEPSDLRKVLDYLGIINWGECNKEVKFLDCEIGLEWQTSKKRDVQLLYSLMVFMIFCRCTLFEAIDRAVGRQSDGGCESEIFRFLNADDFRCPITLEFMNDPVTISTGHTYDRSSILKWFSAGNPTCPKTGKRLTSTDFVPNLALKQLIQKYCSENGIPFAGSVGRTRDMKIKVNAGGNMAAADKALNMLANFLVGRLVNGSGSETNKAAYEIRLLTKTSIFNRSCLVEAGAIPPLLDLLFSCDSSVQENAIAALLNLSKFSGSRRMIAENGGLLIIVDVLKQGLKMEARQHAAGALFYLASVEDYRIIIGEIPEAISALLELLRDGTDRGKKNALVTLFGLLVYPGNHGRVLEAGLVPLLIDQLRSLEREDLITDALAVLASLADKPEGTTAILSAGTLPMILEVLGSSNSSTSREHCVSLLLALCIHERSDVVPVLVKNTSLMGMLYSQLTDGTCRASKKASSLIKILHTFNEKSSFGFSTPALHQERFIHVW